MKISFHPLLNYDVSSETTSGGGSPWLGAAIGGGSSLLGDIFNLFGQSKKQTENRNNTI